MAVSIWKSVSHLIWSDRFHFESIRFNVGSCLNMFNALFQSCLILSLLLKLPPTATTDFIQKWCSCTRTTYYTNCNILPQSQHANEIDEIVKGLKQNPGYKAYLVLNNDGVVLRWDQEGDPMPYEKAVQYSRHVLDLYGKSKGHITELFGVSESWVELSCTV